MPINADTNRVRLSYVEETTPGTAPTNPIFKQFRYTGSSDLKFDYKTEISKEIVSDRQVRDLYLTGAESTGGANIEFSIDSYDDLTEGALFNRWTGVRVRNDQQSTLLISSIEKLTTTTAKIHFDSSVATQPFLTNSIIILRVESDMEGLIAEVTGGTFSTPDFFIEVTSLNGIEFEDHTATASARLDQCGYIFQDAIQATANPNTITSTTDFTTLGLAQYQWVKIGSNSNSANDGFDTTANNGFCRISDIAAGVLTFDKVPTGWAADTNAGSKNIAIFYDAFIQNGTTEIKYTLERAYLDHTPSDFEYFNGMTVNELSISNDKQAVTAGQFSFFGMSSNASSARLSGATDVVVSDSTPFSTVNNINYLELNDVDISGGADSSGINLALKVDLSIKNNLRGQTAIGSLPFVGIGTGQFNVSGTVDTYFQDTSILALLSSNADTSLRVRYNLQNRYQILDMPRVKISSGAPDVSGVNTDVTAEYGFQAIKDEIKGFTLSMSKISTY
jgi:hypothetical protein